MQQWEGMGRLAPRPAAKPAGKRVYTTLEYFCSLNRLTLFGGFDDEDEAARAEGCWDAVLDLLGRAQRCISPTDPASDVARFNAAAPGEAVAVDELTAEVVRVAGEAVRLSRGAFNPMVGPLVDLWGFSPRTFSAREGAVAAMPYDRTPGAGGSLPAPRDEDVAALVRLARCGVPRLVQADGDWFLQKPEAFAAFGNVRVTCQLDLGGIAKGVVVDRIRQMIRGQGFSHGAYSCASSVALLKSAGQLALKRGTGDFTVNLTDPMSDVQNQRDFFMLYAHDRCVSTSGGYGRAREVGGRTCSHIIDPRTGCPREFGSCGRAGEAGVAMPLVDAVTLLGPEAGLGDALATALCVMPAEQAAAFFNEVLAPNGWDIVLAWHDGACGRVATSLPAGSFHLRGNAYELVEMGSLG